jgi:hypothetical protein
MRAQGVSLAASTAMAAPAARRDTSGELVDIDHSFGFSPPIGAKNRTGNSFREHLIMLNVLSGGRGG